MGSFVSGDIVVLDFPFSDLSQSKRRPALVLSSLRGDDLILCQITSQRTHDANAMRLDDGDFASGGLNQSSWIRPTRVFTADSRIIAYRAGRVHRGKLQEAVDRLVNTLRSPA